MRIAVISDIHGNQVALEAVIKDISAQGVDDIICLGDTVLKGPMPSECCALLEQARAKCVLGNTDLVLLAAVGILPQAPCPDLPQIMEHSMPYIEWHVNRMTSKDVNYLASLPFSLYLFDEVGITLVHASPWSCEKAIKPMQPLEEVRAAIGDCCSDWIVMGHIHRPFMMRAGTQTLINCGAVGFSLDYDWRASYALLDTRQHSITLKRVEYDTEAVVQVARDRNYCFDPEWYGEALRKGWWEPVPWEERARTIDIARRK